MAEKKFDDVKINVEFSEDRELKELKSGEGLSVLMGKLAKAVKDIISHLSDGVKHISAEDRENWNNHVNLNLLDNADFKINQRGQKTYSELRGTYNVDRWLAHGSAGGSTITVVDDGIEITINTNKTFSLRQHLEHLEPDAIYTFSIDVDGKRVHVVLSPNSEPHILIGDWGVMLDHDSNIFILSIYNMSGTGKTTKFSSAKLELGSVPTPFIPPNPTLELIKCKAYYQIIDGAYLLSSSSYANGAFWNVNLSVGMRIAPTLILPTISDTTNIVATKETNTLILGGWSWGQYCAAINSNCVQLHLKNTDRGQYANAHLLLACNIPIALNADL